jgi:NAD(P)-dependent dehydrogenase (short-subunit alcohol dehydrogenase family)
MTDIAITVQQDEEDNMAYQIDLIGKVAFITGASSGLGVQFANSLANTGATVVLAARRVDRLQALAKELATTGAKVHCVALDVTSTASIEQAVTQATQLAGPIDILVNNSGVSTTQRIVDVTEADYDFVLDTNTKGAFFVAQTIGKQMIERAKKAQGEGQEPPAQRIINIASVAGIRVLAQISTYSMSKAAVIHMTHAMALEWGRYGINVNAICPGYIETEINADYWGTEGGQKLIQKLPRKRVGKTQDLEGLLLLLASPESRFINGSIMTADDGLAVQ